MCVWLNEQIWDNFQQAINNKYLFIYGMGVGVDYFYEKFQDEVPVEGYIDNDIKKQGVLAGDLLSVNSAKFCGNQLVADISILQNYHQEQIVILITSIRYYEQIAAQLSEQGIINIFSLAKMEEGNSEFEKYKKADYFWQGSVNPKKIVIYAMGNNYSGHGKYIAEQLLNKRTDLEIVWLATDMKIKVPQGIRLVYQPNRRRYLEEMGSAKIWIYDYMVPLNVDKKPEQIYIQIKHWSSITLKTFGYDFSRYKQDAKLNELGEHNEKMIDYIITGSEFDSRTCKSGFGNDCRTIELGSARSDAVFFESKNRARIFQFYHIDDNKRALIYAPTFRFGKNLEYEFQTKLLDFEQVKRGLESRFGGEWIILLRLHPHVAGESKNIAKPPYVVDVSDYPDSQELVAASDIMITDYSSIMFEPSFVKKPVFLYAPDKEEYINVERKLLIDYDNLPFPIAVSNEKLMQCIQNFDPKQYEEKVTKFLDTYGVHEDGHASERAADFILDLIDNGCRG